MCLEVLKIVGAALAFLIGFWQYRKAQRWKRVEFVASEMKAFDDDKAARAAMTMLDWSRKDDMELYRYRDDSNHKTVPVNYAIVADALDIDPNRHFEEVPSAIREIFDQFLGFVERFENFIEAGVVTEEDLIPYLHYWTKLLSGNDSRSPKVTREVLPQFWKFVAYYGYAKVVHFVNRYDRIEPSLQPTLGKG